MFHNISTLPTCSDFVQACVTQGHGIPIANCNAMQYQYQLQYHPIPMSIAIPSNTISLAKRHPRLQNGNFHSTSTYRCTFIFQNPVCTWNLINSCITGAQRSEMTSLWRQFGLFTILSSYWPFCPNKLHMHALNQDVCTLNKKIF